MARSKFKGTYRDGAGNIVSGGTVAVYLSGTTTAASIYKALAGGTAVNSVSSGTDGTFEFWVDPSDYALTQLFKVVMSKTNYTTTTYDELDVFCFSNAIDTDGTLVGNSDGYIPTQKAVKTYADTKVAKSLYDANSILSADADNTPAALTIAEQRILGRITGGNIVGLTAAQIMTMLGTTPFVLGSDADGDIWYRASGALARLAKGTADFRLFMNAAGTAPEWAAGIQMGTFTRAMDAATADVEYNLSAPTFKPSHIIFIAGHSTGGVRASWGFTNGVNSYVLADNHGASASTFITNSAGCILLYEDGTKYQLAVIKSMDADGFTLSWTRTGSTAAATINVYYIAFR